MGNRKGQKKKGMRRDLGKNLSIMENGKGISKLAFFRPMKNSRFLKLSQGKLEEEGKNAGGVPPV